MTAAARPLRVLVNAINDNAVPRGPDRYLLELLPHLLTADPALQVTLCHAPWQSVLAALPEGRGFSRRCLAPPRRPAPRLIWQATQFVRFANRQQPDVVFLPNLIWTPGLAGPAVMTVHDLLHFRAPEKFGKAKAALLRRVIRRAMARAERLVAVSDFTARDAVALGGADPTRMVTIPEGGPPHRPRAGDPPEKFFLFVGKIERTKGVMTLITAFESSRKLAHAGYRLIIAGPPGNAMSEVTARVARSPARDRILLPGFISEAELERLYLTCRGFAFPSEAEGFGLVLLEAMARGAPVIAARATALPEVVGNAGLLVPSGDDRELRQAMERLAEDDTLFDALQRAGYDRLDAFDWAETGRRMARILREVAA